MSAPYRVDVVVGSYSLGVLDTDPPGYGLADPLILQESVPTADLAPLVPRDPAEATVNIIAPDASTYAFSLGDPVRVTVYADPSGGNNYAFFGRLAQLQAQPHKLGIMYTLTCVDYMADLAELSAGRADYPAETALARVTRMLAENGIGAPVVAGVVPATNPNVSARVAATEGTVPLLEALEEVLAGWTESQPNNELGVAATNVITCRYELQPTIVNPGGVVGQGSLDPLNPFTLVPIYRPQGWDPPARYSAVPDSHLTVDPFDSSPATEALVLDAGAVEFAPVYTQQKGNAVQRVVVQADGNGFAVADWTLWGTYQYLPASATVEATVKTRTTSTVLATVAASMYRGSIQPDSSLQWTVGTITWLASRTQAAAWRGPKLRRVCTVARVDAVNVSSHVPTGKAWMAGVVDGLRIVVEKGEVRVGFTLAPMTYTAMGALVNPHQATFASTLETRRNLCTNPSAETSTASWGATNVTLARITTWAAPGSVGTASFQQTPTGVSSDSFQVYSLGGLLPGRTYTISATIRVPTAQVGVLHARARKLVALEYTSGPTFVGGESVQPPNVAGTVQRVSVTFTTRTDRTGGDLRLYTGSNNAADIVQWDAVLIEKAPALNTYLDGSTPAAGTLAYAWLGVANLSASIESVSPTFAQLHPTDTFTDYQLLYAA